MDATTKQTLVGIGALFFVALTVAALAVNQQPQARKRRVVLDVAGCNAAQTLQLPTSPTDQGACVLEAPVMVASDWITVGTTKIYVSHVIALQDEVR